MNWIDVIDHDQEYAKRFHGNPPNILPLKYSMMANTSEKINMKEISGLTNFFNINVAIPKKIDRKDGIIIK